MFLNGARPYRNETGHVEIASDPNLKLVLDRNGAVLELNTAGMKEAGTTPVTTALLGKARVSGQAYENPNGSAFRIDRDYLGKKRNEAHPAPGPFESLRRERIRLTAQE